MYIYFVLLCVLSSGSWVEESNIINWLNPPGLIIGCERDKSTELNHMCKGRGSI
jgi:hypothetical protein